MEIIPWIAVFILAVMLIIYIYYLRHKKAVDTATSRFAKWGTVGAYIFGALFCAGIFYLYTINEPDFPAAWRAHWLDIISLGFASLFSLIMAIVRAIQPDRPREPDDAEVDDVSVGRG